MKKLLFPFLFVSIRVLAASALGPMPAVDSVSDLASYRAPSTQPYIAVRRFAPDRSYWPEERIARYDATATNTIRSGCVDASPTGIGRYIFDDCFDERPIDIRWLGGESFLLTGLTNRFTASFIPIDSQPAWEAARDIKFEQGGGIVKLEYGEYRFGNDTTNGSIIGKPNVSIIGAFGPLGDETHEGTYANDKVARTMIGTAIHIYNPGTNGNGLPPMVFSSKLVPAFTNSLIAYFGDANNEVVNYFRGGISVENIGIFGSWDWPWGGSPYPGACVVIDEVAGITFKNVYFGPSTGPSIYARGAFGLRVYDFFSDTALSPAFTIVDTSDTKFSRGTVATARGASFSFTGELRTNGTFAATANTHVIDDVDVWNNAEDLVGWVGTSQTTTNYTITETSGVRRTGWSADPTTDLIGISTRIGSDSGMPVFVRGTSLPGGLNTNSAYYVKWGTAGGTNFYLCNTSGRAINGGAVVDITSAGGSGTWWLEGPSAQIFARDVEEIKIDGMRADQSMSGVIDFARLDRALINGLFAWEVGLNQTEVRQSRKQTFWDPNVIAIRLEDVNSFNIAGSSIIGSKGNTSLSTPWVHNAIGIMALNVTDSKISGLFDRLNTGIYFDSRCGSVDTDGAAFGSWVSRPIDSTEGYGVLSHVPYFNGNTNSQIVATLGASHTNITGDFAVAMKFRVSEATTNGWPNGRHSTLLNLSSVTNVTSGGALGPKSFVMSTWRSPVNDSINLVCTLGGTNYDQANPSTERFAVGIDVTPFIGKDIEVVVQRATNYLQMYLEGQLKLNTAINNSTTGNIYAPYLLMGQFADSGQYSHPQSPIYGVTVHRAYFTKDEINGGKPWTRFGGTNAVVYWDFDGATQSSGVKDWSGNGHDGIVQQIGAVAPSFGTSREYQVFAGSGITVTRNSKRAVTIAATFDTETLQDAVAAMLSAGPNISIVYDDPSGIITITGTGGGGSTNGSAASVNSTYMSSFNLTSSADITNVVSGTNVAPTLVVQSGVSGTYTNPIATVNSRGIITAITNGPASSGGGGSGTNLFVNGVLTQPARLTNNLTSDAGRVVWYTNAGGDIVAYATNLPAGGSSSNTVVLVNGSAVTNPNLTNTDANVVLSVASSTNVVINMATNPYFAEIRVGSLVVSNDYQSSPINGRAGTFGEYIRTVFNDAVVSVPVEPRLLLLAPIGGQSLGTGSGGVTNSFSTTPRHPSYSLSWTQGVHYGEPGTGGVVISSSALTGVRDLYADVVTGPVRSENPVVAAVDYWNTYWSNNLAGNRARILAVGHALGGAELNAIDEGTASFSNLVAHIQGAAALATSSNWVFNVPVWYFVHGENDTFLDTPVENYRTNFITMYERMNSIAKAASGQSNDPIVIMTQTASRTYENQSNSLPANAQLLLNLSDARIKVAVPTYVFPTVSDGVHLTNIVSAWLGEYLSKAARHELFGTGWNPVMPTNIVISGTNVVIKYHVPKPPLTFDTTLVSNPGNYGYSLDGATIGTPLVSGSTVTIPFTSGTPTRVKYGWNGTLGAADGPTTGQRGNLRDSDTEIGSLTTSNLYNWGLIFNLPTTAPSAPTGLSATGGNGKITLTWARGTDVATYTLKRSLGSGGPYTAIKVTNGTSYEDTDVAPSITYYYVVMAHGPSGDSAQSAEVVGTTSGGSSLTRNWIPTDLGANLVAWYRASSLSSGTGNPIDTWTDESGNGFHLTATSTVRPTQQDSGGRQVVRFDGTDDRMDQTSLGTRFNAIGEANFFTVGRPNTTNVTAGNRNLWYLSRVTNGSVRLALAQGSTTPGRWRYGGTRVDADSTDNDDSGTLIDTNSTVILHTKFDFTNGDKLLLTNGVTDHSDTTFASSGSTAAENLSLFRMGASALAAGGTPTNWYNGDIELQIITTGVLSSDDRQKIEGYIAHALSITNLLSISHPYKTNPPTITTGSSGTSVFVNGSSVSNPNFQNSSNVLFVVSSSTNVTAVLTNVSGSTTITNNFVISTNNLGYLERSVVLVTNTETADEVGHYTITIPGNTLALDGDEVEIHIPGTFSAYTTGTNSAYTFRWSFDSALGGADNVHVVNMASTYFTQTSTEYSLDWKLRIKRIDSNTVVTSSEHFAGPHVDAGSTNNLVSALGTMWIDFDGNLSTDAADFTFYTDIIDNTRAARLKTFGYLVNKVGAASANPGDVVGPSSSVDGELAIMSGTSGKAIRSGGPFRVSQSNLVAAASVTNYVADVSVAPIQFVTATNDVNILHATNAAAGRGTTLLIQASGANRTITLPSNMKRTKTSVVVTNGSIIPINFYAHGADNTNVVATVGSEGF